MNKFTSRVAVRLPTSIQKKFAEKAVRYGGVSHVMRELVSAFVEDRLKIKPPQLKGSMYDVN